jgi:hypothetical protein
VKTATTPILQKRRDAALNFLREHGIDTERSGLHHYFADHQFCLSCGKWEGAPVADDCLLTIEEHEEAWRLGILA